MSLTCLRAFVVVSNCRADRVAGCISLGVRRAPAVVFGAASWGAAARVGRLMASPPPTCAPVGSCVPLSPPRVPCRTSLSLPRTGWCFCAVAWCVGVGWLCMLQMAAHTSDLARELGDLQAALSSEVSCRRNAERACAALETSLDHTARQLASFAMSASGPSPAHSGSAVHSSGISRAGASSQPRRCMHDPCACMIPVHARSLCMDDPCACMMPVHA